MHCALLHNQTVTHHGCNEFIHCCMPRTQSIVVHNASMANTRMSLSHSRHLKCYLKIRYIHGALRSGFAAMRNAHCNNSEDNLFLIRCMISVGNTTFREELMKSLTALPVSLKIRYILSCSVEVRQSRLIFFSSIKLLWRVFGTACERNNTRVELSRAL